MPSAGKVNFRTSCAVSDEKDPIITTPFIICCTRVFTLVPNA